MVQREGKARGTSLMEVLLQDGLDGRPVPEDEGSAAMSTILLGKMPAYPGHVQLTVLLKAVRTPPSP